MEMCRREKFEIESKVSVTPTKIMLFVRILLNIIVVILGIVFLISIICDDFSIYKLGELCLAILVASYYNMSNKPRYQFAMLDLFVTETGLELLYHNVKKSNKCSDLIVNIERSNIIKIEKSDILQAIKIEGHFLAKHNTGSEQYDNWVIYLGNNTEKISKELSDILQIKIENK